MLEGSSRPCCLKRVQPVCHLTDIKNDVHVVKVLKKSFECAKVLSTRLQESKAQRNSGSYKMVAAHKDAKPCCAHLYTGWGIDLHCLECVRAKICTELKSVTKPEKDTALS
jgi:hypothetical protein